jgi:hypothetical protein
MAAFRERRARAAEREASAQKRAAERRQRIDSVTPVIDALEDSVKHSSDDARLTTWLWELGTLWRENLGSYGVGLGAPEIPALARRYPQYFQVDCCEAVYWYNYAHYKGLVQRFPQDTLADDAAYVLTHAPFTGECEGYVPCYIERGFSSVAAFLLAYPQSPYAPEAVSRANEAFVDVLTHRPETGYLWHFDTAAVRGLIASYDTVATALPATLQAEAYQVIGPLWAGFGNASRSQELYRLRVAELRGFGDTLTLRRRWDSLTQAVREPTVRK